MLKKKTVLIAIVLLVAAALIFGFACDASLALIERLTHPKKYEDLVAAAREGYEFVPESMVYAVIKTESGFDENAVSAAGAVGLMQLMPSTFEDISVNFLGEDLPDEKIYDPAVNIRYGVFYLSWLYLKFGDWSTVAAAYNAGIGKVSGWLDDPEYSDDGITLKYIPIKETCDYVKKVSDAKETYEKLYFT